ncbi:MAG: nucleoside deaminase, partial [Clostridia bacterium]|nr:nucleoside deaminase [Clostridia bacterium]
MTDEEIMRLAIEEAKKAADDLEVPVGAVIVRNGEVVSFGRNRREGSRNALAHAEIEAIDKACKALGGWRLWECEMFVTLEPCPMCT